MGSIPATPDGAVPFDFATAQRIVFGDGKSSLLPAVAAELGRRALLVTGARSDRFQAQISGLAGALDAVESFAVAGEPSVSTVLDGVSRAHRANADLVIAIGGGSPIDAGKAIAALAANPGDPSDYLEVVGKGHPLPRAPLPFIAVPTTAGTGAEVTRNAVLSVPEAKVKVSLRSPKMLPDVAIVDPELTHGLPAELTASTGMDALTQLIEPFLCSRANPITDALCRDGIARAAWALPFVVEAPSHALARRDMALASLFGGLALANAGLGAVHGFAGPIGGMFGAPHGALCAALLPPVLQTNLSALRSRAPGSPALARFDELGRLLTGEATAEADDAVAWCQHLVRQLDIPKLSRWGVSESDITEILPMAARASSMKANPVDLSEEELAQILRHAM